jgi:hypothetical protein
MPKSKVRKKRPQQRSAVAPAWRDDPYRSPGRASWPRSAPSEPGEFDAWMTDTFTLRWTVLVTLATVCAAVVLALVLGAENRDLQAFENAPICAAGRSVGCQAEIPVTIEDRGQYGSSKDPTYYVDVSGAAPADGRIELPGQSALWNAATAGDSATAIVWNGVVVRIEDNGVDGDTSEAVGVRTVLVEGLLIAAIVCAAASAVLTARVAQSRLGDEDGWTRILVPLEAPALLASLFFPVGALIGQESESLTTSVALGGGLTAFGCLVLVFNRLRNR